MTRSRVLLLGAGGWARQHWINRVLPDFKNTVNSLAMMEMTNGVKAIYEESSLAAGYTNQWHHEYYRVECEKGSVVTVIGNIILAKFPKDWPTILTRLRFSLAI